MANNIYIYTEIYGIHYMYRQTRVAPIAGACMHFIIIRFLNQNICTQCMLQNASPASWT